MLFLIAVFAVLFLALYDYLHDKANWTFKANILKYAVALGVAWFYSLLQTFKLFQYLEVAGIVVLAGMFAAIIFKWLASLWSWIKEITAKKI